MGVRPGNQARAPGADALEPPHMLPAYGASAIVVDRERDVIALGPGSGDGSQADGCRFALRDLTHRLRPMDTRARGRRDPLSPGAAPAAVVPTAQEGFHDSLHCRQL